jgi:tripartite-type tricarboxylate transporter receptor subunit TctC
LVCQKLGELWSQQVVIENRPGAGGSIGSALVAKAPADGYTLLWNSSAMVSNVALYRALPYDPLKDFVAVAPAMRQPFALIVGSSARVKTLGELLAAARARPGQLTYASAGTGTATHFVAEKFRLAAGLGAVHVPYKGGTEAQADVLAQRVTYWFPPVVLAAAGIRDGRALALAVTSQQRSVLLPGVPTMSEAGLPGVDYSIWWGLWAPAATPASLVDKIAGDVARAIATPDLGEKLLKLGAEPMVMPSGEFARFAQSEMEEALQLARAAGIKAE